MSCCECSYFKRKECFSCQLIDRPYQEQLIFKRELVRAAFLSVGVSAIVAECTPSNLLFGSRNKAKMVVGGSSANPILGIMLENFRMQELVSCPLVLPQIAPMLERIRSGISEYGIEPYSVEERRGELKYCIVRFSEASAEGYVRFVLRSRAQIGQIEKLGLALSQEFSSIKVVSANLQPVHQAVLEGEEEILLTSVDHICDPIGPYMFLCGPQSFAQVTSNVALKLYEHVGAVARRAQPLKLLDLFCGYGGFTSFCAPHARELLGIELSRASIHDARRSASRNGLANTRFEVGDVELFLATCNEPVDFLIANPPRRGLSPRIVEHILRLRPKTLVYSSCNPETLARDVRELGVEYGIASLTPFDMFPLTKHVEAVAVLERK